jgi:hypothetical protein
MTAVRSDSHYPVQLRISDNRSGVGVKDVYTIADSPRKLSPDAVRLNPGRETPLRLVVRDLLL